jgi:hypothetical protein
MPSNNTNNRTANNIINNKEYVLKVEKAIFQKDLIKIYFNFFFRNDK